MTTPDPECPAARHHTFNASKRHGCRCPGPALDAYRAYQARQAAARRGQPRNDSDDGSVTAPDFPSPDTPEPTHDATRLEQALHARRDLACRTADPALFHPATPADQAAAHRICRGCPAVDDCLTVALATGDDWAILGDTTPQQRRHIRNRAGARAA